jgi:nitrite reductase/ring-hydroxylating ferredoxin subunit
LGGWVKACNVDEVPEGTMKSVDLDGRQLMVINLEGQYYALDRTCTHETADLSLGFLTGDVVTCPLHLSRFDIKTGQALSAPATLPLKTYNVKTHGNEVFIEL